mgnify:CR=1 FL=1
MELEKWKRLAIYVKKRRHSRHRLDMTDPNCWKIHATAPYNREFSPSEVEVSFSKDIAVVYLCGDHILHENDIVKGLERIYKIKTYWSKDKFEDPKDRRAKEYPLHHYEE